MDSLMAAKKRPKASNLPSAESAAIANDDNDDNLLLAHDWSRGLPVELLCEIASRIYLVEDFIVFSAVCGSWYHAATMVRAKWHCRNLQMPWLITTRCPYDLDVCVYNPNKDTSFTYTLSNTEFQSLSYFGSSYGWFTMIDHYGDAYLYNPLTSIRFDLPNLQRYRYPATRIRVLKMPPAMGAALDEDGEQFLVAALIAGGEYLLFARPGSDEAWIRVEFRNKEVRVADVTYWNRLLLIMYTDGSVAYCTDINNMSSVKAVDYLPCPGRLRMSLNPTNYVLHQLYMMAESSSGNLLIIHRRRGRWTVARDSGIRTLRFEVYMLDFHTKEWKETSFLGDVALFVGDTGTMFVSNASLVNNCKSNCIYFNDDEIHPPNGDETRVMGFYNMEDNTIQPFYNQVHWMFHPSWFMPMMSP